MAVTNSSVPNDQIERIHKIANNTLSLNDSSDFRTALWEILEVIDPDLEYEHELEYIE